MRGTFLDHFEAIRSGGGVERTTGLSVAELYGDLESGKGLAAVADDLKREPGELVAVLAFGALGDGGPQTGPTLVRGRPIFRVEPALSEPSLAELYPGVSRPRRLALSAGLLQVHDCWEASHTAAQEADDLGESSVSAYWHGIAHRREPDAGNAGYWFRRVGKHPVFVPLAEGAAPLLAGGDEPAGRVIAEGGWDPFAFISLCTRATGRNAEVARAVQRLEMLLLLGASVPPP